MAVTVDQITNGSTGTLDVLMKTIGSHLDTQFQSKRISGETYSEVYLGALTAVIGQSIQFALSVEQNNAQTALIEAQKLNVEAERLQIQAQTALVNKQIEQLTLEIEKGQLEKLLIQKQTDKVAKEILVADKQIQVLQDQIEKSVVEKALMQAKIATEKAQILDVVDGLPVAGIVGKQKELYTGQVAGFARDAEQKLLKIMSDIWAVQKSTDPDAIDPLDTGMHDGNIRVVALKAIQGIGGVPVAPPAAP